MFLTQAFKKLDIRRGRKMDCPYIRSMTLIRPWPYPWKPPWPWRLVEPEAPAEEKVEESVWGAETWIVFAIVLFFLIWSGKNF